MSGSQADEAAESPSGLVARARAMLKERGAPMNAENLNRAMQVMRGGQDEGYVSDVAGNAAQGQNTPRRRAAPTPRAADPVQGPPVPPPTPDQAAAVTAPEATRTAGGEQPVVPAATRGSGFTASMSGGMDPLLGIAITGDMPNAPAAATAPSQRGAQAATIQPTGSGPAQTQAPGGGSVTGPAAVGPSGPSTRQSLRTAAGIDEAGNVTGLPRSMVESILGANAPLRQTGYGAPRPYPFTVEPPGPPMGAIEQNYQGPVERMNVPATRTPYQPPPEMLPPGGAPPPSLPPGPSPVALPNARTPTMIEPPPAQPQLSGPSPQAQLSGPPPRRALTHDPYTEQRQASIELGQELRRRGAEQSTRSRRRTQPSRGDVSTDSR